MATSTRIHVPTPSPQFLKISVAELVNLSLVRRIEIIDSFNCRLWFDQNDSVNVAQDAAKLMFEYLNQFHILNPENV